MTDDEIMGKWVAFVGGGTALRERVLDFAHALEGAFKAEERERCVVAVEAVDVVDFDRYLALIYFGDALRAIKGLSSD